MPGPKIEQIEGASPTFRVVVFRHGSDHPETIGEILEAHEAVALMRRAWDPAKYRRVGVVNERTGFTRDEINAIRAED